jgi:hypothetical protein
MTSIITFLLLTVDRLKKKVSNSIEYLDKSRRKYLSEIILVIQRVTIDIN